MGQPFGKHHQTGRLGKDARKKEDESQDTLVSRLLLFVPLGKAPCP